MEKISNFLSFNVRSIFDSQDFHLGNLLHCHKNILHVAIFIGNNFLYSSNLIIPRYASSTSFILGKVTISSNENSVVTSSEVFLYSFESFVRHME